MAYFPFASITILTSNIQTSGLVTFLFGPVPEVHHKKRHLGMQFCACASQVDLVFHAVIFNVYLNTSTKRAFNMLNLYICVYIHVSLMDHVLCLWKRYEATIVGARETPAKRLT